MKKISIWIIVFLFSLCVFVLEFQDKKILLPNYYYQVYLDDEVKTADTLSGLLSILLMVYKLKNLLHTIIK